MDARDDGYARKAGFRFDKELSADLDSDIRWRICYRRVEHVLDLASRLFTQLIPLSHSTNPIPIHVAVSCILMMRFPLLSPTCCRFPLQTFLHLFYSWPNALDPQPIGIPAYRQLREMPQDGSTFGLSFLE